jgi:hypothetical protein
MDNNVLFHKYRLDPKYIMAEYLNQREITNNPKIKENNIELHKIIWILGENYGIQQYIVEFHINLG